MACPTAYHSPSAATLAEPRRKGIEAVLTQHLILCLCSEMQEARSARLKHALMPSHRGVVAPIPVSLLFLRQQRGTLGGFLPRHLALRPPLHQKILLDKKPRFTIFLTSMIPSETHVVAPDGKSCERCGIQIPSPVICRVSETRRYARKKLLRSEHIGVLHFRDGPMAYLTGAHDSNSLCSP